MNSAYKYLYNKYSKTNQKWYPIMAVYYLTYSCSFRCPFCSDGKGEPYHTLPNKAMSAKEVLKIIKTIRQKCDYIVITGGEPLEYPYLSEVLAGIEVLKFKEVVLTTNGYKLDKYIFEISKVVTSLVISLNTLDKSSTKKFYGVENIDFNKILNNIDLAHSYSPKRYKINISSVVTPQNFEDLYSVYNFSKERDYIFAACPQLVGVKAHEDLKDNKQYIDFYNFLISEKKKGVNIFGTLKYLEYMRELKKFNCNPFTMLAVSPNGQVYYPCLEIGNFAGNLLQNEDLDSILKNGIEKFGEKPNCDTRCHSACALSFSTIIKHPYTIFQEGFIQAKIQINGVIKKLL